MPKDGCSPQQVSWDWFLKKPLGMDNFRIKPSLAHGGNVAFEHPPVVQCIDIVPGRQDGESVSSSCNRFHGGVEHLTAAPRDRLENPGHAAGAAKQVIT